jgi:hypothetical protein
MRADGWTSFEAYTQSEPRPPMSASGDDDAKVEAKAATGPTGRQVGASTHVQPTPRSMAAAEGVSPQMIETVRQAMLRARAADSAGDKSACEQALADVQHALGP